MIKKALTFCFITVVFIACNDSSDSEIPVALIENPLAGDIITTNDGIRLVATLTDDTGLLQYKVVISGIDSLNDIGADSTLHYISVQGVGDGSKAVYLDEVIPLPDSTFNGQYYMTLICIDVEGNQAVRDTVLFEIQNSIDSTEPVFNVFGPSSDTLHPGQGFSPTGSVSDSQSLIYSTIYIGRTDGSQEIHSFSFPNIVNNTVNYDGIGWYFPVDTTWTEGAYHVYYTAWDNYSGVSYEIPFYVSH